MDAGAVTVRCWWARRNDRRSISTICGESACRWRRRCGRESRDTRTSSRSTATAWDATVCISSTWGPTGTASPRRRRPLAGRGRGRTAVRSRRWRRAGWVGDQSHRIGAVVGASGTTRLLRASCQENTPSNTPARTMTRTTESRMASRIASNITGNGTPARCRSGGRDRWSCATSGGPFSGGGPADRVPGRTRRSWRGRRRGRRRCARARGSARAGRATPRRTPARRRGRGGGGRAAAAAAG